MIGAVGIGSVWRAVQAEPLKRLVALKLIRAGMDSKQVLARFDAERHAPAKMDHPNIFEVLDGGIHANRPFFVIELVNGSPITEFRNSRRFATQERLTMFVQACQAIEHAHRRGSFNGTSSQARCWFLLMTISRL